MMTVNDFLKPVLVDTPIKVNGTEVGTYGFIRYANLWSIPPTIMNREVFSVGLTGVENELTITVYGEV